MADITLPNLPVKSGTVDDAGYLHLSESAIDKKLTVAQFLTKISQQYSTDINSFLAAADKPAARAALLIARRASVNDAAYSILASDKIVAQTGTMSASRIFTLPEASTVEAGEEITVIDESGSVSSVNSIVIQRSSADTIDGLTQVAITQPYGVVKLVCNGVDSWQILQLQKVVNSSNENLVIDPQFSIWQEGTTFTTTSGVDTYGSVLFAGNSGTGGSPSLDINQQSFTLGQTDVPNNPKYYLELDVTSAASATAPYGAHKIEDVTKFENKDITVSFWAQGAAGFDIEVEPYQNFGTGGSPSTEVLVTSQTASLTTSWQLITKTFTLPSISGKTLGTDVNSDHLGVRFNMPVSATNTLRIANIKLEAGSVATGFNNVDVGQELDKSLDVFEKIGGLVANHRLSVGFCSSATQGVAIVRYERQKRRIPIVSFSGVTLFRVNTASANNISTNIIALSTSLISTAFNVTVASGLVANNACTIDTASTAGFITLDSRL